MKYLILTGILLLLYVVSIPIRRRNLLLRNLCGLQENIYVVTSVISQELISGICAEYGVEIVSGIQTGKISEKYRKLLILSGNKLGLEVKEVRFRFPESNVNETPENYYFRVVEFIRTDRVELHGKLHKSGDEFYDRNIYGKVVENGLQFRVEYEREKLKNGREIPVDFRTIPENK